MHRYSVFITLLSVTLLMMIINLDLVIGDKCADECSCKWKGGKRTVECINRSLTSIPDKIDPETQVLDASNNDIRILPSNIFIRVNLTNLQRVYLKNCRMIKIDKDALNGLTNLIELDLSYNRLTIIPSDSLSKAPFLRDLSLGFNPLERIFAQAFHTTPNLVKLDLSHAQINEVESNGFRGLESLETLKLNGNRINTLQPGTFEPLNKLTNIALHDNPWICNCHLREMKMWLIKHNLPTPISPICHGPDQLLNKTFSELTIDDFACRPILMITSRYAEATIGENASIICKVSAVPPAKVKWYWNGKLLTNHSSFSTYQKIFINEEGQFNKRSTLILTNAQESDSSEFFCIAENRAGTVEANFTLNVSLRTAGMSTLGSGQIAGISAALVVLILLILLIILILFVRLRRMPIKDVKTATIEILPSNNDINNIDNQQLTSELSTIGANNIDNNIINHTNNINSTTTTTTTNIANNSNINSSNSNSSSSNSNSNNSRKIDEAETTFTNNETHKSTSVSLNINYINNKFNNSNENYHQPHQHQYHHHNQHLQQQQQQRPQHNLDYIFDESQPVFHRPCFSSTASLIPIDNPDLIRDTHTSIEELRNYNSTSDSLDGLIMDETRLIYSTLWNTRDIITNNPTVSNNTSYSSINKDVIQSSIPTIEQFPSGAKQLRVWQKGVPVLPPVSALKRVLGSTRSSPDEGYQEGTGTDV